MAPLSAPEEAREELIGALANWDWTNYFPSDYDPALGIGVQITTEFPSDELLNIERNANGQLTKPIISVVDLNTHKALGDHAGPTLGNVIGLGVVPGTTTRFGQTLEIIFQIDCWADLQLGGGDQAQRLGGGVIDCLFVNQNALAAYRRLMTTGGRLSQSDNSQLWRYMLTVSGRAVQSFDL